MCSFLMGWQHSHTFFYQNGFQSFAMKKNSSSPSTSNPDCEERRGAINKLFPDESETKLWHAVADEYCTMTFPQLKDY